MDRRGWRNFRKSAEFGTEKRVLVFGSPCTPYCLDWHTTRIGNDRIDRADVFAKRRGWDFGIVECKNVKVVRVTKKNLQPPSASWRGPTGWSFFCHAHDFDILTFDNPKVLVYWDLTYMTWDAVSVRPCIRKTLYPYDLVCV